MSVRETHEVLAEISKLLTGAEQISAKMTLDQNRSKLLLLGAASEFEATLCSVVLDFAKTKSGGNDQIVSLIERKAIKRQYHTWFAWNSSNPNAFFGLFGKNFSDHMKDLMIKNEVFAEAAANFMEIGQYRNILTHGNFLITNFPKTAEEVFDSYMKAKHFVTFVRDELDSFT